MTGEYGYTWFLPRFFTDNWWSQTYGEPNMCTVAEMQKAVQGYWTVDYNNLGPMDSHIVGNLTVAQWDSQYRQRLAEMKKAVGIHSINGSSINQK